MAKGERPTHYVSLKNKETGKSIGFADAWPSQFGYNLQFRKERTTDQGKTYPGVAAIKLTDGTIIKPEEWFVNFGENRPMGAQASTNTATPKQEQFDDYGDDTGVPF